MKTKLTIFSLLIASLVAIASCGGDDDNPKPPTPVAPDDPGTTDPQGRYCKADIPEEVVFNYEAAATTFVMETNIDDFQVKASEPWCTAEVTAIPNSTNKKLLKIDVGDYQKMDDQGFYINELPRKATVTVNGGSAFSRTITIVQNSHIYMDVRTNKSPFVDGCLELSPEGETKEIMIETNCYSWTPYTEAEWLAVKRVDSYTLSVTSKPRPDSDVTRREGHVHIENDSDPNNHLSIAVRDAEPNIHGEDYGYDEPTGWDE